MFDEKENIIISGLDALLQTATSHTANSSLKITKMQQKYFEKNQDKYIEDEIHLVKYYLNAALYKFVLSNISLEQLWTLSSLKRNNVYNALENSLKSLDTYDKELIMISFVFESFLLQSRTFLDFIMLYITLVLKTGHKGSISHSKFMKALNNVRDEPFDKKAKEILDYFNSNIYGKPDWNFHHPRYWGTLLSSLRDKIAHRDIIKSSFNSNEYLFDDILFNWPTLRNITYDRFCQYIQNGMFTLFQEITPILFDLKWETGTYNENMWI